MASDNDRSMQTNWMVVGHGLVSRVQALAYAPVLKVIVLALATRFFLLLLGYLALGISSQPDAQTIPHDVSYISGMRSAMAYGDVQWYMSIARDGYEDRPFSADTQANWAFYPLWPLILRFGGFLFGDMVLGGVLIANALFVIAIGLLYTLLRRDYDHGVAFETTFLMMIFPSAYFFARPGPESLFFLLVVVTLLAARDERWPLAGILGALAVLTRLQGIFLLPVLLVLLYRQVRSPRAMLVQGWPLLLLPTTLVAFTLYLWQLTGKFLANHAILRAWDNNLLYPLSGLVEYVRDP